MRKRSLSRALLRIMKEMAYKRPPIPTMRAHTPARRSKAREGVEVAPVLFEVVCVAIEELPP